MKIILITGLLIFLVVLLAGCLKKNVYQPMDTVRKVDLQRYTGRWHEIARYPHRFEKGCSAVTADYSLLADGTIEVVNQCTLAEEGGRNKKAQGRAKVVDTLSNAKLKVSFFWPFYGDYWILKLDDEYQYAIVGEPSRKYVWILSRSPRMDEELYGQLVVEVQKLGYDPNLLIKTENSETDSL